MAFENVQHRDIHKNTVTAGDPNHLRAGLFEGHASAQVTPTGGSAEATTGAGLSKNGAGVNAGNTEAFYADDQTALGNLKTNLSSLFNATDSNSISNIISNLGSQDANLQQNGLHALTALSQEFSAATTGLSDFAKKQSNNLLADGTAQASLQDGMKDLNFDAQAITDANTLAGKGDLKGAINKLQSEFDPTIGHFTTDTRGDLSDAQRYLTQDVPLPGPAGPAGPTGQPGDAGPAGPTGTDAPAPVTPPAPVQEPIPYAAPNPENTAAVSAGSAFENSHPHLARAHQREATANSDVQAVGAALQGGNFDPASLQRLLANAGRQESEYRNGTNTALRGNGISLSGINVAEARLDNKTASAAIHRARVDIRNGDYLGAAAAAQQVMTAQHASDQLIMTQIGIGTQPL